MTPDPAPTTTIDRDRLLAFYDRYYAVLDDVDLAQWPAFFTEACLYRIIPRENHERGYSLCTVQAESRGMLQDRVTGLTRTQMFAPRSYRRFPTTPRVVATEADGSVRVRHNLLVVQTLLDRQSDIVIAGVCHDHVREEGDQLLFRERVVVIDSEMIPNSLVYPA